jgi:hypothetical protein
MHGAAGPKLLSAWAVVDVAGRVISKVAARDASGTDGKPACKAWDAAHDPRRPDLIVQPDNRQILHCDGLRG